MRAFFFDQQLPADDVVPVGLFALEIELHQVVLCQVAGREAQRPVVVVGGQAQRFRRGGRLTLVVEQGAQTQQLDQRQVVLLLEQVEARQLFELDRFAVETHQRRQQQLLFLVEARQVEFCRM